MSPLFVAAALAKRLADRDIERLIAPGDFVATSDFEPRASEIRRWAFNSAVDTIVVGRIVPSSETGEDRSQVVETILRSGHSGARFASHEVVVPRDGDLAPYIDKLADAILGDLDYVESPSAEILTGAPTSVDSGAADPGGGPGGETSSSESGLGVVLSESEFRRDAPIEIKAEEAEIINGHDGRKLIFQRNVWVRKDNVTLRSDRLEASYSKGESEPRELIAEGRVQIVQNDRRAKCDRAIYLREANRLVCSGRAELAQGCDIIRGESIEFDLAGDQARVEGAASIVIHSNEKENEHESVPCETNRGQL
jgi:lipopolysaccharide transport protein LptA